VQAAVFCSLHDKKPRLIRALISRAERSDLPQGFMRPGRNTNSKCGPYQQAGDQTDFLPARRSWPCASLPGGTAVAFVQGPCREHLTSNQRAFHSVYTGVPILHRRSAPRPLGERSGSWRLRFFLPALHRSSYRRSLAFAGSAGQHRTWHSTVFSCAERSIANRSPAFRGAVRQHMTCKVMLFFRH